MPHAPRNVVQRRTVPPLDVGLLAAASKPGLQRLGSNQAMKILETTLGEEVETTLGEEVKTDVGRLGRDEDASFGPCEPRFGISGGLLRRTEELTRVRRQSVMHVRRSDRGMAESHAQLMQIGHDVPCRIKAINGRPLMVINFEVAVLG
jgi:hypothetical protein